MALLAAISLAVLGATAVSAPSASGEEAAVEVRVAARRLADGRTEFAAQQRQADGAWAERQLPSARFFPASTRVGRWLASSPLAVSAPDGGGEAEIRVAAQLLVDGRMEFALQERGPDGEWGERQLPRARFFPADARVGRWLSSSPLTVSLPEPEGSGSVASDRAALVAFYNATGRPAWLVNWLSDSPLGEWHGVTTNSAGRVTELSLHPESRPHLAIFGGSGESPGDTPLAGPLPPELGDLTSLERLDLSRNRFSGPIPPELGNLTNLKDLNLNAGFGYLNYAGCVPAGLPSTAGTGRPFCNLEEDRAALVAVYEATGGANWGNSTNWLSDMPLGEWHGVTTRLGYVVGLSLRDIEWSGPIPAEVVNLTSLESLELADNGFSGPIPPELGNLTNLKSLSLVRNQLSGPIPAALGNLPNLESLILEDNELSGPVPPELGNLTNLISLRFRDNQLTGPIPPELGSLTNVGWLSLADNGLSGPIPPELGNLTNLTSLSLNDNELSGPIPPELGNLTNLTSLSLNDNELSGLVPPELGNLTKLKFLNLDDNQLTGCIPAGLPGRGEPPSCDSEEDRAALVALYEATGGANWPDSANWLSDKPIGEWYGVTATSGYVWQLWLHGNELTGPIPPELGNLTSLTRLRLSRNELSGAIPPELGNLTQLQRLDLSDNELSGVIPPELGNLTQLHLLHLSDNELSGCVPDGLRGVVTSDGSDLDLPLCDEPGTPRALQLPVLVALYNATDGANWRFSANWLSDRPIGEWHGIGTDSSGYVTHLYLQENQLSGQIPAELSSLTSLRVLYLRNNELSGPIPAALGSLTTLEQLWTQDNELSGPIPAELGSLTNLQILYLQDNALSGPIPAEFASLTSLWELDLRGNRLEGCVPNALRGMLHLGFGLPFCE